MKPKISILMPHQADIRDVVQDQLFKEVSSATRWEAGTFRRVEGGSCISSLRWKMIKAFLEDEKEDYALFVDSDMVVITQGTIDQLVKVAESYNNLAIVSALFGKKTPPYAPTYSPILVEDKEHILNGEVMEKDSTGMAFTLIHRDVAKAVFGFCDKVNSEMKDVPKEFQRKEQPFQPFIYNNLYTGEDRAFCLRAGWCNIPTVIVPIMVGHIGDCAYTPDSWIRKDTNVK